MPTRPIPEGYEGVTPYLIVKNAAAALDFYRKAFGAEELMRMEAPGGKIGHAEIRIGGRPVMLSDEWPDMGYVGPETLGGSAVSLHFYVDDVDSAFARAVAAGAKELRPVQDQFYGDRTGTLKDPFGHTWSLATHREDLTPEEMDKRHEEFKKKMAGG